MRLRDSADAVGQTGLETISAPSAAAIWEAAAEPRDDDDDEEEDFSVVLQCSS